MGKVTRHDEGSLGGDSQGEHVIIIRVVMQDLGNALRGQDRHKSSVASNQACSLEACLPEAFSQPRLSQNPGELCQQTGALRQRHKRICRKSFEQLSRDSVPEQGGHNDIGVEHHGHWLARGGHRQPP